MDEQWSKTSVPGIFVAARRLMLIVRRARWRMAILNVGHDALGHNSHCGMIRNFERRFWMLCSRRCCGWCRVGVVAWVFSRECRRAATKKGRIVPLRELENVVDGF